MIKGKTLYEKCLKTSTPEKQLIKFVEESSELNQAIAKYLLAPNAAGLDHLIEELIDTELMIKQLKYHIKQEHNIYYKIKKKQKLEKINNKLNGTNGKTT